MSSIVVREARAEDASTIVDFNRAMALESEGKHLDTAVLTRGVTYLLTHPADGFYLVAERDGAVAGALMVTFEWSDWRDGRFWWIQSVFVKHEHRRQGVYSALHEHVRDRAADAEACGIRLYVERENKGAQATYANLGMVETAYRLFEEDFTPNRR